MIKIRLQSLVITAEHSKIVRAVFKHLKFVLGLNKKIQMAEITISNKDWERVKIKVQRKYNSLTNEQLQYTEGNEEDLIVNLMKLVNRNREYVVFTLKKALVNIDNNRL